MQSDVEKMKDILETFSLMESLISQKHVLNISITPYELSTLMKEYRAEKPTYNQVGNNAMTMFYSDEEKEDFENFLRSKGVKFTDIGDPVSNTGELSGINAQSPVAVKQLNKYGV